MRVLIEILAAATDDFCLEFEDLPVGAEVYISTVGGHARHRLRCL